jgi:hypothetical protein
MFSAPQAPSLVAGVGSTPVAWTEVRRAKKLGHAIIDKLGFDTLEQRACRDARGKIFRLIKILARAPASSRCRLPERHRAVAHGTSIHFLRNPSR